MKNIFATIEYVAEKILEAITGHKNDEQAHPNLSEQINVLSTDRGYLTSKDINNMDDLKFNGKFIFSGEIEGITASWHVDVTSGINTHLQIATTTWDNTGNTRGITLTRIFCDGKWSGWQQIATTTKTDILLESEWANMDSSSMPFRAIKTGNIVTLSGIIKAGIVTHTQVIATLPTEYRPKKYIPFTCMKYRKNEQAAFAVNASNGTLIVYNRANELTITTGEDISFNFSYNID